MAKLPITINLIDGSKVYSEIDDKNEFGVKSDEDTINHRIRWIANNGTLIGGTFYPQHSILSISKKGRLKKDETKRNN